MIEGVLTDIQERINNKALSGVDYDDEIEGEDEALESIPFIIEKKLSHWSERIHFPVAILPLYIAGVILSRITCPTPLPLWADLCFVLVELLLMRISYKNLEYTHVMVAWLITVFLFLGCFFLVPWMLLISPRSFDGKALSEYRQTHRRTLGTSSICNYRGSDYYPKG